METAEVTGAEVAEWLASDEGWQWSQMEYGELAGEPVLFSWREIHRDPDDATDEEETWAWSKPSRWWAPGATPIPGDFLGAHLVRWWRMCQAQFWGDGPYPDDDFGVDPTRI